MPITVTAPVGELTVAGERDILPRLTEALVEISGGAGNDFFTALVGGTLQLLDPARVYGGGVRRPIIMVELKLPNIGLPDVASRARFVAAATAIVAGCSRPGRAPEDTWVNILNAPDGGWGIGGRAYTGSALIEAVAAAG